MKPHRITFGIALMIAAGLMVAVAGATPPPLRSSAGLPTSILRLSAGKLAAPSLLRLPKGGECCWLAQRRAAVSSRMV